MKSALVAFSSVFISSLDFSLHGDLYLIPDLNYYSDANLVANPVVPKLGLETVGEAF